MQRSTSDRWVRAERLTRPLHSKDHSFIPFISLTSVRVPEHEHHSFNIASPDELIFVHQVAIVVRCVVWLVFLDPQRSIHHAKAPAWPEGLGRCELNHREPPWPWALQLAPGGRLGPQPVPGERGMERLLCPTIIYIHTHTFVHKGSCLNNMGIISLPAAVPGYVSWWALHREASEGSHAEVQEAAGRDNQLHQEEERRKEAALLQHVPWQDPKQRRCLRNALWNPSLMSPVWF